ncbi:helix-turn-helix transcriptional regulator (plasmid) [Bacillus megaterium]|nr:helix-turn-helix transcriptional regulator [Priestia megaterium]
MYQTHHKSTISQIERGNRSIHVESLTKICNALGVTLNDVLPINASQEKQMPLILLK